MNNLNKHSLEGFIEYAKEANTRSTLAVEDGLKPVHRRILFGMYEGRFYHNEPFGGAAKIVGAVLGNYHPHGDASVYDAAIRLSQDFKLRYPLIDFYGNGGSILDPDSYAASRYTKMRLSPLGQMMLDDINKNTVDMVENYNGELMEPVVLPSMIPNILLNGGMGIGVGVSSSLVPHNLGEVVDGINAYIENPRITTEDLMKHIQGPDFPTGGVIIDGFNLGEIYETGRGTIKVRSKYRIEHTSGRPNIVITEAPYLISIESRIIESIKQLVTEDGYEHIYDVQNTSGKNGLEIRIVLEKDVNPNVVIQKLVEKTGFENSIKINNTVMLSDGTFVTLGLRGLISYYLKHQHSVLTRKYNWELNKAEERLHIVEGLIIAVQNIDEVVKIIKSSTNTTTAKTALIKAFKLSEAQAQAILDMRLARLTSLEINKLENEKKELLSKIKEYKEIISSEAKRNKLIVSFLNNLKTKFADPRRTKITELNIIEKGDHVYIVTDSHGNFYSMLKDEIPVTGSGKRPIQISKNDIVAAIECNTKDNLLLLDCQGKVQLVLAKDIVEGKIETEHHTIQILRPEDKDYMIFVTKNGIIKKTPAVKFRKSTQITKVREEDKLIGMYYANDDDYIMALGSEGKIINLLVSDIPTIGKLTYGSQGMDTAAILSATVSTSNDLIFTMTSDNKAKLTKHSDFLINTKGSTGQVATDDCIFIMNINTSNFITLFSQNGKAISLDAANLSIKGRTAGGAKISSEKFATAIAL